MIFHENRLLMKYHSVFFQTFEKMHNAVVIGVLRVKRTCNGLAVFWPTMDFAEI